MNDTTHEPTKLANSNRGFPQIHPPVQTTYNIEKSPATGTGMQSQSCYSSKQVQGRHQHESNHNRRRGMMQSIPSFPTQALKKVSLADNSYTNI